MTVSTAQESKLERARESLVARWLHARTTREFAAVEELSLALLRRWPRHVGFRRALARTLTELGRPADAAPHWQQLLDLNPRDIEAEFHLSGRQSPPSACEDRFRHIAICGVSFCGSTLMDGILGSLPKAANIGESHWLTGMRRSTGYGPIDFDAPDRDALRHCSRCGPDCTTLTMDFRRDLASDGTGWYGKIARRLDTRILISADKNPPKLVDHDPLMRFDALVMFKSPAMAWMSTLRRLPPDRDDAFYLRECKSYLALWGNRYSTLLDHFTPRGRVVFLNFDEFARAPRDILYRLCGGLDLAFDARVLETAAGSHSIGGNPNAVANLNSADSSIAIARLAAPDCPADQLRMIEGAGHAQETFGRLMSAYRETLPA